MSISLKNLKDKWATMPITAKASIAYAVCNIIQRCLSFITMPLFTRLMSKEQYGEMTVYTSWSSIFSIILTLNLAYGSFSPAMMKYEKDRDGYVSSIQGICLLLGLFFLSIYLPFKSFWNGMLKLPTFLVIMLFFETLSTNSVNLWSGRRRFDFVYKPIIILTLGMTITSTTASLIAVKLSENKGYARIVGHSAIIIIFGIIIFFLNQIKGKKIFNKEYWTYALRFNIPLLAYYLSQTIFNQSDRIMIDHYCGKGEAAVYGVAYSLAMILTFVLNAINNSYVPWLYQKIRDGKEEDNSKVSLGIATLMAGLIMLVVIMAPEIIRIMAGKEYSEAVWIIPPVAISLLLLFYSQLFINIQFYYEQKGKLVYASIGAAIANIVLNAILIPRISYIAAGYTTMLSYVIFAIANYITMCSVAKETSFSLKAMNIKMLILLFIGFCAICFLFMALYNFLIVRYTIVVVVGIIMFVFRKPLLVFVKRTIKIK